MVLTRGQRIVIWEEGATARFGLYLSPSSRIGHSWVAMDDGMWCWPTDRIAKAAA